MKATKKQSEFVEDIFDYYNLPKYHFFYELDDDHKEVGIPLMINENLSQALGMTIDEIKSMDNKAAMRWNDKYPFFSYYDKYLSQWEINSKYVDGTTPEDLFLNAIFGEKSKERYDYKSVKQRLINQLKQIDIYIPGTYHIGETITNLKISTEVLFSFPQTSKMLKSFIDIVNRVESQFFRMLVEDLPEEEIIEYNFLVTWLQMTDIVIPSRLMTYNYVKSLSHVFKAEGYKKLTSYVRIRSFIGTSPWRCKEFFDDINLVRKFAVIFPETKVEIRYFLMAVSNFACHFTWSDAKPISSSLDEEREPTLVYVPKTDEEMPGWLFYIEQMKKLVQPFSKRGLSLPKPEANSQKLSDFNRMINHLNAYTEVK